MRHSHITRNTEHWRWLPLFSYPYILNEQDVDDLDCTEFGDDVAQRNFLITFGEDFTPDFCTGFTERVCG